MPVALTASIVDLVANDNATFQDAIQFGLSTDTWTLTGQSFKMEVKASRDDVAPLVTWTSGAGQIIIDDATNRIIHFNVPDTVLQASLPPACYVYDLVMYDASVPPIRTVLMQGHFVVEHGVTED
jgi:hypothetical protein